MTAMVSLVLFGMAAFSVDVGRWYLEARHAQRAADAAALAGVPYLPSNPTQAYATAKDYAKRNGYNTTDSGVSVTSKLDSPTQLEVTVGRKVPSLIGQLLGVKGATIKRTAVADYAGPVPLGSPCNEYGTDPDSLKYDSSKADYIPDTSGVRSQYCTSTSSFWGSIGSISTPLKNGDPYSNCNVDSPATGQIGDCSTNPDYDASGYYYTVTVTKPTVNLHIQVFDPGLISVGNTCYASYAHLYNGTNATNGSNAAEWSSVPSWSTDWSRYVAGYASGATSPDPLNKRYCDGDINEIAGGDSATTPNAISSGYANQVATQYIVRDPGPNSWDPDSFPETQSCTNRSTGDTVFPGYTGNLAAALTPANTAYKTLPTSNSAVAALGSKLATEATKTGYVASVFRKWVDICTIGVAAPGTYLVQVRTSGLGMDAAQGENRFSIRAYGGTSGDNKDDIAVAGFEKMGVFANVPAGISSFNLVRVPSGAAGMVLNVEMFDVGDLSSSSTVMGKIRVIPPSNSGFSSPYNCTATGPGPTYSGKPASASGLKNNCELDNVNKNYGYDKSWAAIQVPIPAGYTCDDLDSHACWFTLQYNYGGSAPATDNTAWRAWIEGDPVRLIK